jgi:hypothetical protein
VRKDGYDDWDGWYSYLLRVLVWAVIVCEGDLTGSTAFRDDLACYRSALPDYVERVGDWFCEGDCSQSGDNDGLETHSEIGVSSFAMMNPPSYV